MGAGKLNRSEEHTSELQSLRRLVCRLLLEKKRGTETGADLGPPGPGGPANVAATRTDIKAPPSPTPRGTPPVGEPDQGPCAGFFFNDTATTEIYTLSPHDALPIYPELVFLDELTTGLDPQARRAIWELVRGIRGRGKTGFLTTHLLEGGQRL